MRLATLFVCLLASLPLAAAEQPVPGPAEPLGAGQYLQVGLSLLLIVLIIVVLAWLLRRVGNLPIGGGALIRVVAAVSLGQRERVVLLQVGEKQLLLGVAPGRVETLHVLDEPLTPEAVGRGGGFAERLSSALGRKGES